MADKSVCQLPRSIILSSGTPFFELFQYSGAYVLGVLCQFWMFSRVEAVRESEYSAYAIDSTGDRGAFIIFTKIFDIHRYGLCVG